MAVVQISRIQVRRGKKNQGTGMPQLASGELAWAIDTQELYIGNGAVVEGAPYVGNTKILTENSSLLELANIYQYKKRDSYIFPGTVSRTLQERLDDGRVNAKNFGIKSIDELTPEEIENGLEDQSSKIQVAVDNLSQVDGFKSITLEFDPGEYIISSTINLPSNVRISGSGKAKYVKELTNGPWVLTYGTSFKFTEQGVAFKTQDSASKISLKDFSIRTIENNSIGLEINKVSESNFKNLGIGYYLDGQGLSVGSSVDNRIGIKINGIPDSPSNNFYKGIELKSLTFAVHSEGDFSYSYFDEFLIEWALKGFKLGDNSSTGCNYNRITNSVFNQVTQEGIFIEKGTGNISSGNVFKFVGGNTFNIIKFNDQGNSSEQDIFERSALLEQGTGSYPQEIGGVVYREKSETKQISLESTFGSKFLALRLPVGDATGYEVKYLYKSTNFNQVRKGTLHINFESISNQKELVDEYEYAGLDPAGEDAIKFSLEFENINGIKHIRIEYINNNGINNGPSSVLDDNTFTYVYSMLS